MIEKEMLLQKSDEIWRKKLIRSEYFKSDDFIFRVFIPINTRKELYCQTFIQFFNNQIEISVHLDEKETNKKIRSAFDKNNSVEKIIEGVSLQKEMIKIKIFPFLSFVFDCKSITNKEVCFPVFRIIFLNESVTLKEMEKIWNKIFSFFK